MREFHSRFCRFLLIVLSVATLPINAAEPGPAIKLPNGVSSPDGKKIVAPLDSRFHSVQVDLESADRKEWPDSFVDGAFSSDNQFVLTKNGALIDAQTRQRVRAFNGGQERIHCAKFSPDFQYVVTGSADRTVRIWDFQTGAELSKLEGHAEEVVDVAMDHKNEFVLSGSRKDGSIRIWDWKQKKLRHSFTAHPNFLDSVRFSTDGRQVITAGWNESVRIWNTDTGELITQLATPQKIIGLAVNPHGGQFATNNEHLDHVVRVWDVATGALQYSLEHSRAKGPVPFGSDTVKAAGFSPDGARIVTCAREAIVWDAKTGRQVVKLLDAKEIRFVYFRPDGLQIVGGSNESIKIWNATTGELMKSIPNAMAIRSMIISPNGEKVVAAGLQFSAAVWDRDTGRQDFELKGGHSWQIWSLAFSPSGSRIATASFDQTARLWDGQTGELIAVLDGHHDRVQYVTFSPSGGYVFTGSGPNENTGCIWDGKTGQRIAQLKGHTDKVLHARFSRDEKWVLTGSQDNSARLWEVASGKELHKFQHGSTISSVTFSPNDKQILTTSSGKLSLYWTTPEGYRMNEGSSNSQEQSARLWDRETGEELFKFEHPAGASASFNEDGTQVITQSQGKTTVWSALTGKEVQP